MNRGDAPKNANLLRKTEHRRLPREFSLEARRLGTPPRWHTPRARPPKGLIATGDLCPFLGSHSCWAHRRPPFCAVSRTPWSSIFVSDTRVRIGISSGRAVPTELTFRGTAGTDFCESGIFWGVES